jgi:hypothetical protein
MDLVISQPILNKERFGGLISSDLKKNTKRFLSIPSAYYNGYFPNFGTLNGVVGKINLVHDHIVVKSYLGGSTVDETLSLIDMHDNVDNSVIISQHIQSLSSLHKREIEFSLDVKISDFNTQLSK